MSNVVHIDDWIRKNVWEENVRMGHPQEFTEAIDGLLAAGRIKAIRMKNQYGQMEWAYYKNTETHDEPGYLSEEGQMQARELEKSIR
ncbi:MAG: hypothetical protein ACWGQW_04140 [bacterium]